MRPDIILLATVFVAWIASIAAPPLLADEPAAQSLQIKSEQLAKRLIATVNRLKTEQGQVQRRLDAVPKVGNPLRTGESEALQAEREELRTRIEALRMHVLRVQANHAELRALMETAKQLADKPDARAEVERLSTD